MCITSFKMGKCPIRRYITTSFKVLPLKSMFFWTFETYVLQRFFEVFPLSGDYFPKFTPKTLK